MANAVSWELHAIFLQTINSNCHHGARTRINLTRVRTATDTPMRWDQMFVLFATIWKSANAKDVVRPETVSQFCINALPDIVM